MKKIYLLTKTLLVAVVLMVGASNVWGDTNAFSQDFTTVGESTNPSDYGFALSYGSGSSAEKVSYTVTDGILKCEANAGESKARTGLALATFSAISSNKIITLSYKWQITGAYAGANTETYIGNSSGKALNIKWEPTGGATSQGNLTINGNNAFVNTDQRAMRGSTYTVTATLDLGTKKITSLVMTNSASSTWNYTLVGEMDFNSDISTIDRFGFSNQSKSNYTLTTSLDDLLINYKAYYSYAINAVDGSSKVLKTFDTGKYVEGDDAITYNYPQKLLVGNTLYSVSDGKTKDFNFSFTPNKDDYSANVSYSGTSVSNVIYYSEAEQISGVSESSQDQAYASMKKVGRTFTAGGDEVYKNIITLPAGKYKIYARGVNSNSADRTCNFKVGDELKWTFTITKSSTNIVSTGNSEDITVASDAMLSFSCGASNQSGLDWIYVTGTIDEGADVTGLIVNPDMEIAGSGSGYQEVVKGWSNTDNVVNYRRLTNSSGDVNNESGAFTNTYSFENWTNAVGGLTGKMSQTINGLPNGVYRLQLAALARTVNGQFVYGKSNGKTYKTTLAGANGTANDYEVIVVVEDNQLEIGLDMNGAGADWAAIDNARLTYAPYVSVTIGASGFATFSSPYALNFDDTDVTPYCASAAAGGEVTMTKLTDDIAANTGLFLKGDNVADTYVIPVVATAGSVPATNYLKPTTGNNIYDGEKCQYVYAFQNSTYGFFKVASTGLAPAKGKAYLETAASAAGARMTITFDDEVTGIENLTPALSEGKGAFYDLQGRRVAQPTKGLYIVNGRKVVVK